MHRAEPIVRCSAGSGKAIRRYSRGHRIDGARVSRIAPHVSRLFSRDGVDHLITEIRNAKQFHSRVSQPSIRSRKLLMRYVIIIAPGAWFSW
jgi:hypothetical protein